MDLQNTFKKVYASLGLGEKEAKPEEDEDEEKKQKLIDSMKKAFKTPT